MTIVNGREKAEEILGNLEREVAKLAFAPLICDVLIGEDPVALSYVNIKAKRAEEIGMNFKLIRLPKVSSTSEVINEIKKVQADPDLCGLIVQLPLPDSLDSAQIIGSIDPEFDIDGLNGGNFTPPTAAAVVHILDSLGIDLANKKILVIGQGDLVGKPVTALLKQRGYEVIVADKSTADLNSLTLMADIIITGTGQPGLIKGEMIKPNAVLIDCGTSESSGSIVGDIDTESVTSKASVLAPVPGGVGPVTVAKLLENVVMVAKTKNKK